MSQKELVFTDKAPPPLPFFSQAVKYNGMVYCSGNIGLNPTTMKIVEGNVAERTTQALTNLSHILICAGSHLDNVVKLNIYLTDMANFAAMNSAYEKFFFKEPKPARTCVAVYQLPMGTDVEIECTAFIDEGSAMVAKNKL